jgi:hypothetical protein
VKAPRSKAADEEKDVNWIGVGGRALIVTSTRLARIPRIDATTAHRV